MVDLRLEPHVLLLAEIELEFDDFLLLAQVSDQRAKLNELGIIIHDVPVASLRSSRGSCLLDA